MRQQCVELVKLRRLRLVGREAGGVFELSDDRIEGAVGVMRRAEIAQARVRRTRQFLEKRGGQAGLADAGLARDQHDLPLVAFGLPPAPAEQFDVLLAGDERRCPRTQGLEPAQHAAAAQHLSDPLPPGKTLDLDGAEGTLFEEVADEPVCARIDQDRVRLSEALQSGGKVRGLSDHRLLLRRSAAQ